MGLPQLHDFEVVDNEPLAEGVFGLTLKPADGPVFDFSAGHWVMLHLLNDDGTTWAKAPFSIASAPSESRESIELAIKIYGDFTKRASTLKPGDKVKVQGPYGNFVLHDSDAPLIMFAGGIGVTPFRSIIRELALTHDPRQAVLFYSNRTRSGMTFEEELKELSSKHGSIKVVLILTGDRPEGWEGETRRLDADMLKAHITDKGEAEYMMCGPAGMMEGIGETLADQTPDIKTRLRKELF